MAVNDRPSFLVAGGGIGGLAAAVALSRRGYDVRVLESDPTFSEIGAGLQLGPNASRMLDRLDLLEQVQESAFFPKRLVLMDALSGSMITALDAGAAFVHRYGYPYLVTHRSDLLHVLLDACRASATVSLEASKKVVGVEHLDAGVRVSCADGTAYTADALIGADGLRSVVRQGVIGDGEPVCSAYVAYRGTVPMANMRERAGLDRLDDMVIWAGPGLHLVQYPVRRGELCNQVAVFHSQAYEDGADVWGTEEELEAAFAGMCTAVANGVALVDRTRRWSMFDRLPTTGWTRGRLTLLGDAAHPMLQYLAQGACQAIEDAVVLAEAVDAHAGAVEAAFAEYELERARRTAEVQTSARAFGDVLHIAGVGALMRRELLGRRAPGDFDITDWLYGYDVPHGPSLQQAALTTAGPLGRERGSAIEDPSEPTAGSVLGP
jgi:2-polyprenyl-6-methoxyphenol hydroxylase-like FAD-dependent oxidoreductase